MGKGRAPCCDKSQVKKGPWSPSEDLKLIAFIQKHGHENWRALPKQAGLQRCGKSCRLRWINYLRPDVKRGNFTLEEEETIIRLHKALGNKWSKIASGLPGRTDNEIKNVWNTHLKKRIAPAKSSETSSADESKMESSVTSPSSSSSESFFSSETPNDVAKTNNSPTNETSEQASQVVTTMAEKIEQDSGKQVSNEIVGITEDPKGSSISLSNVECKPQQQQLESPLNYQGPYDVDNTLEEVDKPNNDLIEIPWDPDYDFWKMLDNLEIEPFQSNEVQIGDAEAKMWSHEFGNEFGLGELTKESNKDHFPPKDYEADQQGKMDLDTFDLDLVTKPEAELDLGYIQLWPSNTSL